MDYTFVILELYDIFFDNQTILSVDEEKVDDAIKIMRDTYNPNSEDSSRNCDTKSVIDYDNVYFQYAYLHKYAMLHTGFTCHILQMIFKDRYVFCDIKSKKQLNLCSLGGGPGTDIVALLFVLKEVFGHTDCKIRVIDYAHGWKLVFERLLLKMISTFCDKTRPMPSWSQNYEYLNADLLRLPQVIPPNVYDSIKNADILTMIKFISALDRDKARQMLKTIFCIMKQGSMLLFIDNAGGGFYELLKEVARECEEWGMVSVFGPVRDYVYREPRFSRYLHGWPSLSKTTVTVEMWKKYYATDHLLQILPPEVVPSAQSSTRNKESENYL